MAFADRILQLKLVADVSDLNRGMSKAEGRLGSFGRNAKSMLKVGALAAVATGVELVTEALGNAWQGFREGQKAGARLANTWKRLGLPADDLEERLTSIGDLAKGFGIDDVEATDAFNRLTLATKDPEEAAKRLQIAMDLVASGTAGDLNGAIKMIQQASNGSKRAVDQFGLTADTAAGRVDQLGSAVAGAAASAAAMDPVGTIMNALNEDLEGIVGALATGDIDGAFAAMAAAGTDVKSFLDEAGPKLQAFLDPLTGGVFGTFITGLQQLTADFGPKIIELFGAWIGMAGALVTAIQNVLNFLRPLIDALAPAVAGSLGFVLTLVGGIIDTITKLLNGDLSGAFKAVGDTIGALAKIVTDTLGKILAGLIGLLPNVLDAAAKIGQGIVDGIVNGVRGLANRITSLIRGAINRVIDLWNSIDFALPEVSIPIPSMRLGEGTVFDTGNIGGGTFRLWGASGDLIPDVPRLASGGIVRRPTLAMIGEAGREAVIPLGHGGGLGDTYVTVNIQAGIGDPVEIGRQVDRVLTAFRKRAGKPI